MKTAAISAIVAASIFTMASAQVALAQAFQVLRPGDSQMTCEAMTAEINSLNQTVREQTERAQRDAQRTAENRATNARVGRGLLAGLRQGVQMAAMGNFSAGGGVSAAAAATAAGVAVSEMNNESANAAPVTAAPVSAPDTPERQRAAHLTTMFGQRC